MGPTDEVSSKATKSVAHCGVSGGGPHHCEPHIAGRHLDEVEIESCPQVWL